MSSDSLNKNERKKRSGTTQHVPKIDSDRREDWRTLTEEQWRKRLGDKRFYILRKAGTEQAHTGIYCDSKEIGAYRCAGCSAVLFLSDHKYDSGTGWPSFDRPAEAASVEERADYSHGMNRIEILCERCGSHLGHVFEDGPVLTTGRRYCINSMSLQFDSSANKK
jgi:peptide-methionine (R)-S-oxide reductase